MSMKPRLFPFVPAFCVLAVASGVPSPISAGSHRITDPSPQEIRPLEHECQARAMRRNPCHVHRHETFERLPKNDPALSDPHAREEYLEHMKARSRSRDRPGGPPG